MKDKLKIHQYENLTLSRIINKILNPILEELKKELHHLYLKKLRNEPTPHKHYVNLFSTNYYTKFDSLTKIIQPQKEIHILRFDSPERFSEELKFQIIRMKYIYIYIHPLDENFYLLLNYGNSNPYYKSSY